jgi:hypothetical protein
MTPPFLRPFGPLHPFLFATLFVLTWFRDYQDFASWTQLAGYLAVVLLGSTALLALVNWMIGDGMRTGIIASCLLLFLFFYGDIQAGLNRIIPEYPAATYGRNRFVLPVFLLGFGGLIVSIWRTPRDLRRWNRMLDAIAAATTIITAIQIGFHQPTVWDESNSTGYLAPIVQQARLKPAPDIYYIVLDSHTSIESLEKHWNCNHRDWRQELQQRGFRTIPDAQSNYADTMHSMSSTLNMKYMSTDPEAPWGEQVVYLRERIRKALVVQHLQQAGYKIVNLSLFDLAGQERFYHFKGLIDSAAWPALFRRTLLGTILIVVEDIAKQGRINLEIFRQLRQLPTNRPGNSPLFVYAHVMMPHYPYLFRRDGRSRKSNPHRRDKAAYLEQLLYTDRLVLDVVDAILQKSPRPPVVVLQADHGFRYLHGPEGPQEETSILNAYLLPGGGDKMLYAGITPVNSFRLILNYYLGANYELLKDRIYKSKETKSPVAR